MKKIVLKFIQRSMNDSR